MLNSKEAAVLMRFMLAGGLNTSVGLVIVASVRSIGATEYIANAAGLAGGLAVGFTINRGWTFKSGRKATTTVPLYFVAFTLAYLLNLLVLNFCLQVWHLNPNLAQGVALIMYSSLFYILCRSLVFRASSI